MSWGAGAIRRLFRLGSPHPFGGASIMQTTDRLSTSLSIIMVELVMAKIQSAELSLYDKANRQSSMGFAVVNARTSAPICKVRTRPKRANTPPPATETLPPQRHDGGWVADGLRPQPALRRH